jgi:predicted acyl esterase
VTEDLEVTGYAKLRLWVQADGSDDMDLFVALRRIDATGRHVTFPLDSIHNNGEASLGWLRVSKRTLDPDRSSDFQPVLTHDRELRLSPGEIVPVDIEFRPSGTLFRAGDTLCVLIQGSDIVKNEISAIRHTDLRNQGRHILHVGGKYDSYVLLPIIPPRS